ncbi:MAG TPA: response regulator, partial [Gemmatimonadaceae bacterium]
TDRAAAGRLVAGEHSALSMSLRIVVIDDNVDLVESLLSVLQHLGHVGYGATSGEEGVKLVEAKRPDVALVDVGMPGMSGTDVAAQIRSRSWGSGVILIALTGWGRDEDRELCREAGFDHVAVKPVDLDYLQVMLERVSAFTPHSVPAVTQAARTESPFNAARP